MSVLVSEKNHVLSIELARPEKRNALNKEVIDKLTEAFRSVPQNKNLRAVILKGQGPSFCAGADLSHMKEMGESSLEDNQKGSLKLFEMFESIAFCPLPVIGQIHGSVRGGGLGLVSSCDIVAADAKTNFGFAEVKLGLVPAVISPFALRKMRKDMAVEWMLTGGVFDAVQAKSSGLVQFVGSGEEVQNYVDTVFVPNSSRGAAGYKGNQTPFAICFRRPCKLGRDQKNHSPCDC